MIRTSMWLPQHRRPTHPGIFIREDVLPQLGLSAADLAKRIGLSRSHVSAILNGKRSVRPPDIWLRMQLAVDMWDALHSPDARKDLGD